MPTAKKKPLTEMDVRSLARAYTATNIKTLAGYAAAKDTDVDPEIKLRAIGMLLDRGWGKPAQDNTHMHEVKGEIRVVLRKMLDDPDD
jgi:hypothetical protein